MPELSRFFGIVIRMFVEAGGSHHLPHLHAYYQEHVGIYGIGPNRIDCGIAPKTSGTTCPCLGRAPPGRVTFELEHFARWPPAL